MEEQSVCFTCQHEVSSGYVMFCQEEEALKASPHLWVVQSQNVVGVLAMRQTGQTERKDAN